MRREVASSPAPPGVAPPWPWRSRRPRCGCGATHRSARWASRSWSSPGTTTPSSTAGASRTSAPSVGTCRSRSWPHTWPWCGLRWVRQGRVLASLCHTGLRMGRAWQAIAKSSYRGPVGSASASRPQCISRKVIVPTQWAILVNRTNPDSSFRRRGGGRQAANAMAPTGNVPLPLPAPRGDPPRPCNAFRQWAQAP